MTNNIFDIAHALISSAPISEARYTAWAYYQGYRHAWYDLPRFTNDELLEECAGHWQTRLASCIDAYKAGAELCQVVPQTPRAQCLENAVFLRGIFAILTLPS